MVWSVQMAVLGWFLISLVVAFSEGLGSGAGMFFAGIGVALVFAGLIKFIWDFVDDDY